MRAVNVAELKNQLSAFLQRVRGGEELLIRDRSLPIAKIVPLREEDMEPDDLALVASGQMVLPKKQFDEKRFWQIGGRAKKSRRVEKAIRQAIEEERQQRYAIVLGHKRNSAHLRTRPGK